MSSQSEMSVNFIIWRQVMSKQEYPYARMSPITVMEDFPIGTVIKEHWNVDHRGEHTSKEIVEGYIFNGEYWFPAYNTWDGWCEYFGNDGDEIYHPETNTESQALEDWLTAIDEIEKGQ